MTVMSISDYSPTYSSRPTRAIISLDAFKHNFNVVNQIKASSTSIMAVVKANAYGHGLIEMSKLFSQLGANYLGVALLEEAIILRKNNIDTPILVLGGVQLEQIIDFINLNIDLTCASLELAIEISNIASLLQKNAKIHIKIDTGMGRIGVQWFNAKQFIKEVYKLPNLEIIGVYSHFAKANTDKKFTEKQIDRFNTIVEWMKKNGYEAKYFHIANSVGVMDYPNAHFNMIRPGLMLYGYNQSSNNSIKLKPALTLLTKVSYFKSVRKGSGISYNHSYVAKNDTRIVTLPIGYADGYSTLLSNKSCVYINVTKYPIVGDICMDQTMVDIGPKGTAYIGDDVLLFGKYNNKEINLQNTCKKSSISIYEFLISISSRVPRFYVEKQL